MKYFVSLFLLLFIACTRMFAQSHFDAHPSAFYVANSQPSLFNRPTKNRLFKPDRQQYYRPKAIMLNNVQGSMYQTDMYWMSATTTQSYNHGKIGRLYLWDVQGNLRESRMFFDITGKNKRGIKLVFSRVRLGL